MSYSLTPQQRLALNKLVSTLPMPDFEQLLFSIEAPDYLLPSEQVAQGARAAALFKWVKGPTGCGLEEFLLLLEEVAPKAFQEALEVRSQGVDSPSASGSPRLVKPGAPFLAPPLPRHFVPRPEHLETVKTQLLDEAQPNTLVISAIYGMGGIGKSVLAAALVQESDVQTRFPDGILWVTLGQQPDMLSMVNQWIRELGDYDYNPTTLEAASLHLRTLLADKQALLVVDDVWHPEHVKPFRIGGAGCCVLVTTRQTQIVGATRYDLDLLTPQQSLDLLTQYLPHKLNEIEQAQAATFAQEVGYLPLALELAAAQIEQGVSWTELLDAFQAEMAALDLDSDVEAISDDATRKQYSLEASFKLTLKLLKPQQLEQFSWLGIVPEDVTLTQSMAATLWHVNSFQAGKILREFKNRALLLPQAQRPGEKPTYRIHDLVHDLAKNLLTHEQALGELPGLGLTIEDAHRQFLERYQCQMQDGLWHTVPDDGYIHRHLAWHFEQAQQPALLHQLLRESTPEGRNGWYEACDRLGQIATFVTDVARAWQAAEALYEQNAMESLALQCCYALITTTLNSLAQSIPPKLMAAFVQKGFWQSAQGLAYVRQIQTPWQRAEGLTELLPYLPEGLMQEALEVARSLEDEYYRARALSSLTQYLPEVAREAWDVAHSLEDESFHAFALSALAPYLPEALMQEAWDVAHSLEDEDDRAAALSSLAPYLPEALMHRALEVARSLEDKYDRAYALSALVPYLPEVAREALEVAHSLEDESFQAFTLSSLVPYLPEALMHKAWDVARCFQDENDRAAALGGLAPYLPKALMHEALEVARCLQKESARAAALSALAPYLPEVAREALEVARCLQKESERAAALSGLAKYLPETLMHKALEVTRCLQKESARAAALSALAPYLPEALMREAWDAASSLQDQYERAAALSGLAKYLPETLMHEALEVVHCLQKESDRVVALSGLIPYLPEALMHKAWDVASSLQDESAWAYALSGLAKYLPEALMREALNVTGSLQDEDDQAYALSGLAPSLPEALMREAWDVAGSLQDESAQAYALSGLAKYLPEALMPEALEVARCFQDESAQAYALSGLAKYL
ncbi:MAG: hypothetical protein F6K42_10925, partial [Leptolyngbya sp. SIO1D8]|nr:hypothetical protein [Leptolyngbya sp. SIO1D8]